MDRFGVLGQRRLLSSSVLVVRAVGIGSTLLLFLAASGMGLITVVKHDDVELSNLHQYVIHTKGRRLTSKARSSRDAMRSVNPTLLVTPMTEPLTWDSAMELVRGNKCVMDAINNPRTHYLINDACVMEGGEPKMAEMTNGVSGRGGGPIPLVSGSAMGIKGQLTVYNHSEGGGGVIPMPLPQSQPFGSEKRFFCYR